MTFDDGVTSRQESELISALTCAVQHFIIIVRVCVTDREKETTLLRPFELASVSSWMCNGGLCSPGVLLDAVNRGWPDQRGLGWQRGAWFAVGGVGWGAELQRAIWVGVVGCGGIIGAGKSACGVLAACALQGDGLDARGGWSWDRRIGAKHSS